MSNYYIEPDELLENGFYKEEDGSGDAVRWVWYKRDVMIGDTEMYFQIVVTYELAIYDDPDASYSDNLYYSYERTECFLRDQNHVIIFKSPFSLRSFEDLEKLEGMFV